MVEALVEAVEGGKPAWLLFEKVAGCLEKIGEKGQKSSPEGSKILNYKSEIMNLGKGCGKKCKNQNGGEGEVGELVEKSGAGGFFAGGEAGAGVPVGGEILEIVRDKDEGGGEEWVR